MRILFVVFALALAGCDQDESLTAYGGAGSWRLTSLDGSGFTARATMTLGKRGVAFGAAPCNEWNARQSAPYPWFRLTGIVATRRACPELPLEVTFLEALASMTLSEVAGDTLLLSNQHGREMEFKADAPDG